MVRIPKSATDDERMIELAKRLNLEIPPQPLSSTSWIRLWADIGMELSWKEPEFGPGRGRPLGSKSRKVSSFVSPAAHRKRRERAKKMSLLWRLVKRDKK
jgi:hypothetical protein